MASLSNSYVSRLLPLRMPRVCVAVIGADASEMIEKAETLVRDNTFLEFRLDYLSKPVLALPKIKEFNDYHPHVVSIATCRRVASGGRFRGSIASQLDVLTKAVAAGCQLVDVELQTASKCKPEQLQRLRTRAALILSYHDFRATKKLEETLGKMTAFPSDFYKIVTTATTLYDNVSMMKFLEQRKRPAFAGRTVHGGARHYQPRPGSSRRQCLHLRRRERGATYSARPGHGAGTAQHLPH